jgi:hypothetical protein
VTLFCRAVVGATPDLRVIVSEILNRGAPNVEELDFPVDGWKMGAPIGSPCVVLAVQWYDPVYGFRPEQDPPNVDELAERYGACP